jgi:ABC-type Zn2+ transport system substrate-binding protein/surface adhesin
MILAYSGQRLEGMTENCTGSKGPQGNTVFQKNMKEEEKEEKEREEEEEEKEGKEEKEEDDKEEKEEKEEEKKKEKEKKRMEKEERRRNKKLWPLFTYCSMLQMKILKDNCIKIWSSFMF